METGEEQGGRKMTIGAYIRRRMTALAPWRKEDENRLIVLAPSLEELRRKKRAYKRALVTIGLFLGLVVVTAGIAYAAWRFL